VVCSWRVHAAAFAAAAILLCCVCVVAVPARAADDEDATVILFSGRDLWRNGAFAYGGLLLAPGGFEDDGLMFELVLSGGFHRYKADSLGGQEVICSEMVGQIMPGWRIKRGVEAKIFFGGSSSANQSNVRLKRVTAMVMATSISTQSAIAS
jgi:hypothetical protein